MAISVYITYDLSSFIVLSMLRTEGIPGGGPGLPAGMVDVTNRLGEIPFPVEGKYTYSVGGNSFSAYVPPAATKAVLEGTTLPPLHNKWLQWAQAYTQLVAVSAASGLVSAASAKRDTEWSAYLTALGTWNSAS